MGSTPNTTMLRWQRDAHKALGDLLKLDLPVVTWRIPISGALVGDVDTLTSTPVEMRAAFDAWARQLDATVTPERTSSDGASHLYGKFRLDVGYGVGGAIRATIYPPFDEDGAP